MSSNFLFTVYDFFPPASTLSLFFQTLQEHDEQLRRQREDRAQAERRFQQKLQEEMATLAELQDRVEQLSLRKEELKQQLEDKNAELEEVKEAYRYLPLWLS